ncbi:ABC transporter ATP-binding protein [Corynebacterium sp. CCM 9203]
MTSEMDDMRSTDHTTPAISITGVTRTFGSGDRAVRAVDDVTLEINAGEIVALLGPNGAGKTSLIDMICGFSTPGNGSIRVFGGQPSAVTGSGRIACVPQSGGLNPYLTVQKTLLLIAAAQGVDTGRIDEVAERAGITGLMKRRVKSCSGGEQQRIKFAVSLIADPDLIILDEPTTGMDTGARREFWAAISRDADAGRTIIFATHYLAEAEEHAERVVVMAHGRIISDGSVHDLLGARARTVTITGAPPEAVSLACTGLDARVDGDRITVAPNHSDELARRLLRIPGVRDLIIHQPSLEQVFLELTADSTARATATGVDTHSAH